MNFKSIFGNISVLMTGTVIAQLIPILFSPILTRIYTPAEFGMLAVFMSCSNIFSIFANFRLDTAIMSAENEKEKKILKNLSLIFTLAFSLILILALIIFADFFKEVYSGINYLYIIIFVPLFIILYGITQLFTYICNSYGQYTIISKSKIDKNLSMTFIQVILGFCKMGVKGLLIGMVLCFFFPIYRMKKCVGMEKVSYNFRDYILVLSKYKKYPLVSTSTAFMDTFANEAPILFMNKFINSDTVGFFDLARRTVFVPLSFISVSISQVYLKQITEENSGKNNLKLTLYILMGLLLLSAGIAPFFIFWGDTVFAIVFGENWRVVGEYLKILIFPFLIRFIVSPISVVFLRPKNILIGSTWQFFHLVISVLISIVFLNKGIEIYLVAFAISEVIAYLLYLVLILYAVKRT
ncbi:lipopolysaccharide biosynthesis protein [Lysinibacillus telephonicus]|uniref:lipopolysaccharide biosynthesis protein n=1 Tax=Lysinibacillus telephonicus TaxID=1714840 RepID=UPI003B9F8088